MTRKDADQEMKPRSEMFKAVAAASDAVLGAAVLTGLGAWGGLYLDEKLNASPWFAVSLGLLGAGLGLARMVKKALDAEKADEQPKSRKAGDKPRAVPDNSQESGSDSIL